MHIDPKYRTATLLESRQALPPHGVWHDCEPGRLVRVADDVAMCGCGHWWHQPPYGPPRRVESAEAAALARAPMPAFEALDALRHGEAELARMAL